MSRCRRKKRDLNGRDHHDGGDNAAKGIKNSECIPQTTNDNENTGQDTTTPSTLHHKRQRHGGGGGGFFFLPCHLAMLQSLYPKNEAAENAELWKMIHDFLQKRFYLESCRDDCFHREMLHQEAKEWADKHNNNKNNNNNNNNSAAAASKTKHKTNDWNAALPDCIESNRLSSLSSLQPFSFSSSLASSSSAAASSWNLVSALLHKKQELSHSKTKRLLHPFSSLHVQVKDRLDKLKRELVAVRRQEEERRDHWQRRFGQGQFLHKSANSANNNANNNHLSFIKVTMQSKIVLWELLLESVQVTTQE